MTQALTSVPKSPRASAPSLPAGVSKIRYLSHVPSSAKAIRTFQQPTTRVAVEEKLDWSSLQSAEADGEPLDCMTLVVLPPDAAQETKRATEGWIAAPDSPGAISTTSFVLNNCKVRWRPGKAVLQGLPDAVERAKEALLEFAFLEGELRRLERMLEKQEKIAPADVPRAHRIRFIHRREWPRIGETVERLYSMRLTYGRLESRVATVLHTMQRESRQVMERLVEETGLGERMEGVSDRLETCEDLYEGANDRIADYHWYLEGGWMELTIIVLLVGEIVLMAADVYMKHLK